MAKYYTVNSVPHTFKQVEKTGLFTEEERMGTEPCDIECECGGEHVWFMFPEWSDAVKQGGKQYCMCLNCLRHMHL